MKIEQQGLTKQTETKLLASSDAILIPTVNTESVRGQIQLTLKLNLVFRDSVSNQGSGTLDETALSEGTDLAFRDLLHTLYPDKYKEPEKPVAKKEKETDGSTPESGAIWRSALLPGWGQIYKGNAYDSTSTKYKGYTFIGLTLLFGGAILSANQNYSSKESAYSGVQTNTILFAAVLGSPDTNPNYLSISLLQNMQSDGAQASLEKSASNLTIASGLFVGFYLFNLVDAYFLGGKKDTRNAMNQSEYQFFASPRVTRVPGLATTETGWDIKITGRF